MNRKINLLAIAVFVVGASVVIGHQLLRPEQPFPYCTAARLDPEHPGEYQVYDSSTDAWCSVFFATQKPWRPEKTLAPLLRAHHIVRYYEVEDGNVVILFHNPSRPENKDPVWGVWTKSLLAQVEARS
jgi:hypothetical protein